jgi:hypothetical protein
LDPCATLVLIALGVKFITVSWDLMHLCAFTAFFDSLLLYSL